MKKIVKNELRRRERVSNVFYLTDWRYENDECLRHDGDSFGVESQIFKLRVYYRESGSWVVSCVRYRSARLTAFHLQNNKYPQTESITKYDLLAFQSLVVVLRYRDERITNADFLLTILMALWKQYSFMIIWLSH